MCKYCCFFLMPVLVSLLFLSCSRKTITFRGDSSLFAPSEFRSETPRDISFWVFKRNELKKKEFLLKEGSYQIIYTKEPILFYPLGLFLSWRIAYPGDTLQISENEYSSLVYQTTNRSRNIEMFCSNLLDSLFFAANKEILRNYYTSDTLSSYEINNITEGIRQRISILTKRKKTLLDSISSEYLLSEEHFLKDRRYEIQADSLSNTYWLFNKFLKPSTSRGEWLEICRRFGCDLDNMKIDKVSFFYFRKCADELFRLIEKENRVGSELKATSDFIQCSNLINYNFTGRAKDYLLSILMYNTLSKRIEIPKNYIKNYFEQCRDNRYKVEIKGKIKQKRKLDLIKSTTEGSDLLAIGTKRITTIEDIIDNQKGNIILIDFWASWCVPCREELPFLRLLENDYRGKKIRFIKISFDREIEKWEYASRNEGFMQNNYVFIDSNQSTMVTKYNINIIPRFMLIGKDGKMIESNAPLPSDKNLRLLIEKWLNN